MVVRFPFTDGSEFKKRPALIISNESVNKTGDYLIAQITSKQINDKLSISVGETDCLKPMPLKSYIRVHKIFTVSKSLILSKITAVKPEFFNLVSGKIYSLIEYKS
ncbi:MAG: type II toxin-antitoxin system PemK/MazF family toxin [Bacteroidota bacterium]|nr:type II toxin-antitoxin system PemK/MazF family toxin [Bacteroidota bacterium]